MPWKTITNLLDYLEVKEYRKLEGYATEDVNAKFSSLYPGLANNLPEGLIKVAIAEAGQYKRRFELIHKYFEYYGGFAKRKGDIIIDASEGIAKHVEECRNENSCLHKYILWLERKAKSIVEAEGFVQDYNEEDLEIIETLKMLDLKYLDLSVF